jgi:hypothetical protein
MICRRRTGARLDARANLVIRSGRQFWESHVILGLWEDGPTGSYSFEARGDRSHPFGAIIDVPPAASLNPLTGGATGPTWSSSEGSICGGSVSIP